MEELKIERQIGNDKITITLTEDELERAYWMRILQTPLPMPRRTRTPGSTLDIWKNFLS